LRDALSIANDGDTIDATGVSGTIWLTSGELLVNYSITISGPGASHLAVDGNAQGAVFDISSAGPVTISGLTITDGNIGSGIDNYSDLTMNDCTVSGNYTGGIANYGTLTMNDCTISGNNAGTSSSVGGGIYSNATVTLNNCTVSNNWASESGGGIYNDISQYDGVSSTVTLNNCTVSGNTAATNDGGGICNNIWGFYNDYTTGTVVISNSTLSNNTAIGNGGAISNTSQTYNGYAVATLHVNNSTFSGNSAPGGGIYSSSDGSPATVTLRNTILKAGGLGQNIQNVSGTIASQGYNLSSDNGGGYLTHPGDRINTNPLLGPLQDNGGPTFTQALLPGSPAINAGDPSFTPPPLYDQRGLGFDRVRNGRIDIGSFEVQAATPTPTPTPTSTPRPTPTPRVGPTPRVRPTPVPRSFVR
jgi:hypothetical protein